MSFLLKNRSVLAILKSNYGSQYVRNISVVTNTSVNKKNEILRVRKSCVLISRRNESTNTEAVESSNKKDLQEEESAKFSRDHYDVIVVGGGMVRLRSKYLHQFNFFNLSDWPLTSLFDCKTPNIVRQKYTDVGRSLENQERSKRQIQQQMFCNKSTNCKPSKVNRCMGLY